MHNLIKYEFDFQFDIPATYPLTAPEIGEGCARVYEQLQACEGPSQLGEWLSQVPLDAVCFVRKPPPHSHTRPFIGFQLSLVGSAASQTALPAGGLPKQAPTQSHYPSQSMFQYIWGLTVGRDTKCAWNYPPLSIACIKAWKVGQEALRESAQACSYGTAVVRAGGQKNTRITAQRTWQGPGQPNLVMQFLLANSG